jgi:serine/threonine protein kinase
MLISADGHVKLTDFGLSCFGVISETDVISDNQYQEEVCGLAASRQLLGSFWTASRQLLGSF